MSQHLPSPLGTIFGNLEQLSVGQRVHFDANLVRAAFPEHSYFVLESAEDQFRSLLNQSTVGFWELDRVEEGSSVVGYAVERIG